MLALEVGDDLLVLLSADLAVASAELSRPPDLYVVRSCSSQKDVRQDHGTLGPLGPHEPTPVWGPTTCGGGVEMWESNWRKTVRPSVRPRPG